MRIRIDSHWIAGHPGHDPLDWTGAQDARWTPSRLGAWHGGSGHERGGFEDRGNAAFTLSFGVTRCFRTIRDAAGFVTALHSRQPPHPWRGRAYVLYDHPPHGSVEIDCGECVLQLAGPAQSIEQTGNLTVVLSYMLHGGVLGAQPVIVDPTAPPTPPPYYDFESYYDLDPDLDEQQPPLGAPPPP